MTGEMRSWLKFPLGSSGDFIELRTSGAMTVAHIDQVLAFLALAREHAERAEKKSASALRGGDEGKVPNSASESPPGSHRDGWG